MNQDMKNLVEHLGDYSIEYRICQLLLFFAASDGVLSEQEIITTTQYMKGMLQGIGSDTDLKTLVLGCLEDLKTPNVELLKETIRLFAEYLPTNKLQVIASGIEEVIGSDELSEAEAHLMACLKQDWGLA